MKAASYTEPHFDRSLHGDPYNRDFNKAQVSRAATLRHLLNRFRKYRAAKKVHQ
jgi:hypothetical protein